MTCVLAFSAQKRKAKMAWKFLKWHTISWILTIRIALAIQSNASADNYTLTPQGGLELFHAVLDGNSTSVTPKFERAPDFPDQLDDFRRPREILVLNYVPLPHEPDEDHRKEQHRTTVYDLMTWLRFKKHGIHDKLQFRHESVRWRSLFIK